MLHYAVLYNDKDYVQLIPDPWDKLKWQQQDIVIKQMKQEDDICRK